MALCGTSSRPLVLVAWDSHFALLCPSRQSIKSNVRCTGGVWAGFSLKLLGGHRKGRRVKPGYIPPEEMEKFQSKGSKVMAEREGYVAGLGANSSAPAPQPLTKNQKRNAKKKADRAAKAAAGAVSAPPRCDTAACKRAAVRGADQIVSCHDGPQCRLGAEKLMCR